MGAHLAFTKLGAFAQFSASNREPNINFPHQMAMLLNRLPNLLFHMAPHWIS